jgi:hypothetical protein
MGSLISDNGSSSSPDSLLEGNNKLRSYESPLRKFSLKPIPAHASCQDRKTSDTSSINTVKGNTSTLSPSPLETSRRVAFELSPGKRPGQRASSYLGVTSGISLSDTSPNVPRVRECASMSSHSSTNFLSRIWGAATKAQDKVDLSNIGNKLTVGPPVISIVEPKESYPYLHGASAFRRLVHSRSAVFRNGDV